MLERDLPQAHLKYARISPRKMKVVLDLIRGKDVGEAMAILKNTRKSGAEYLTKLLASAVANAENNEKYSYLDISKLYVYKCLATPGPSFKRMMPRAKGSGDIILKRTSHATIILLERGKEKEVER